ncbi:MAG TPA: UbiD family decarboxylase, partial [Chloroflexi bacterium]|nr:UbiD family decarboxylase [Chloroflexota bacterium]
MSLRLFLDKARQAGLLHTVAEEVDPHLEMARIISRLEGPPLLFERAAGYDLPVVASVCGARENLALDLGVGAGQLLFVLAEALANPSAPPLLRDGPCQEVVDEQVNLRRLPILAHLPHDGGSYITAGMAVTKDAEGRRNASFHRLLLMDESKLVARIVEGRGTDLLLRESDGEVEIAICIGNSIPVLIAAATSPPAGVDELGIANALHPTPLVKCVTVDLEIPADTEIVLEGRITQATAPEGPFLD